MTTTLYLMRSCWSQFETKEPPRCRNRRQVDAAVCHAEEAGAVAFLRKQHTSKINCFLQARKEYVASSKVPNFSKNNYGTCTCVK